MGFASGLRCAWQTGKENREKMPTDERYLHSDVTNLILQAYYKVFNTLGYGLARQVYINELYIECRRLGLVIEKEAQADILY